MMSSLRQEPAVRSYEVTHPAGTVVPPQPPGWDQLVYAAAGVLTVVTPGGRWVTPPTRAVWVPDGVVHRIEVAGRARVRNLYLAAGLVPGWAHPRVVEVPPLVREVVLALARRAPVDADDARGLRLAAVLADELAALDDAPLHLPLPLDDRAHAVASAILADPGRRATVDALAAEVGASRRTIERAFAAETGLPVARWRTQARLLEALRLLAAGEPTVRVAGAVGFATPSAFVAAFRRTLGTTPQRWFAPRSGPTQPRPRAALWDQNGTTSPDQSVVQPPAGGLNTPMIAPVGSLTMP
jgi:AraC-like DNA-binding protein